MFDVNVVPASVWELDMLENSDAKFPAPALGDVLRNGDVGHVFAHDLEVENPYGWHFFLMRFRPAYRNALVAAYHRLARGSFGTVFRVLMVLL